MVTEVMPQGTVHEPVTAAALQPAGPEKVTSCANVMLLHSIAIITIQLPKALCICFIRIICGREERVFAPVCRCLSCVVCNQGLGMLPEALRTAPAGQMAAPTSARRREVAPVAAG
jgi:hypothetical protein